MKVFRHGRADQGRLPSLGQDHDQGHREYVAALGNDAWLRTKPFSQPPTYELGRCLHSFAHIVDALRIGPGARVLDIGCGPGWLSEFLARCGYEVTGVDVSEDMVRIARERIVAAGDGSAGRELLAEFFAMPVRQIPWIEQFDAAILYDAMHHFDEELDTLRAIRRALVPGGRIYVHEGIRPASGSEGERQLIEEMERYGTLESPFDPEYLLRVVEDAGFRDVRRLVEVDRLVDPAGWLTELRIMWKRLRNPDTNTLIATNPYPDGSPGYAQTLAAEISLVERSPVRPEEATLRLRVRIKNTGTHQWPAATLGAAVARGGVTVASFVRAGSTRQELGRASLPWSVRPGETVEVDVAANRAAIGDASELEIDLVSEGVAWFGDLGTRPLIVAVEGGSTAP